MTEVSGVPVGRRNLLCDRRRAFLGIAGIGVALLMVIALDGIFAGTMREVTSYIDSSEADVFVSQRGVRTMHMSSSSLPLDAVEQIGRLPSVRWADPVLYDSGALMASEERVLTYLIGYVPGQPGGPPSLVAGAAPGPGEIVLDERAAESLLLGVGGRVETLGRSWRVSGLTTGMTNIVNSVSYLRFDDFARARDVEGMASYVLVGASGAPDELAGRIESATGFTAQSRERFSAEERGRVEDMSVELMQIMTFAAFLIGLAVIGLTLHAETLARLREIGVMKALGAGPRRLGFVVLSQAAWTVGIALALAVVFALGLGWVLGRMAATIPLVVEASSVLEAAAGAALLGAVGAVSPLIKVSRVDPAAVFRR
ncbi:MAG TPA: ABC transporter permease [Actinomycetota bacterium]|nr:ABC transporter permease [Actinomycetota bacterium]